MPDLDLAAHDQEPDGNCQCDLSILSREKNFSLIETIGRRTASHCQKEHRQTGSEIGQSKQERFVRERAQHVTLCYYLHPCSYVEHRTADDVAVNWSRAQNTQCVSCAPLPS